VLKEMAVLTVKNTSIELFFHQLCASKYPYMCVDAHTHTCLCGIAPQQALRCSP